MGGLQYGSTPGETYYYFMSPNLRSRVSAKKLSLHAVVTGENDPRSVQELFIYEINNTLSLWFINDYF